MQNFIKTMFNSIREWTKSEIFKSESKLKRQISENKADWAQNDESADNYIKNRTHWIEEATVTLVDNLTYEDYDNGNKPQCTFVVGEKYDVIWNGTLYEGLECHLEGEWRVIASEQTGQPFYIDDNGGDDLYISGDDSDWTVSIIGKGLKFHHLDPKYMPDEITESLQRHSEDIDSLWDEVSDVRETANDALSISARQITLPFTTTWNDLIYSNGKFVAVPATTGHVIYSNDGINWEEASVPSSKQLYYITYGNGIFVAIGYANSTVVYSDDGINWSAGVIPLDLWSAIAYGNGRFVTTTSGNSSHAAYSDDGVNWTRNTLPFSGNWYDVIYGNEKFVAFSSGSKKYAYSDDGINWVQNTLPSSVSRNSATYGNGMFVAIGGGLTVKPLYSYDGINWLAGTAPSGYYDMLSMTYGNGMFVATCGNKKTFYSYDGINWSAGTMPITGNDCHITYDGEKFLAIASHTINPAYSYDGINWFDTYEILTQNNENVVDKVKDIILETDFIPSPTTAQVGQTVVVKSVDENGKPTEWEYADVKGTSSWNDLEDKPTKLSSFENDTNYATETFVTNKIAEAELGGEEVDLSGYATKDDIKDFIKEVPAEYVTETELTAKGYLTQHQDLSSYAKKSELPTKLSDLNEDATHRTVTDIEKSAWGAKAEISDIPTTPADIGAQPAGNYALKSEIPNVPVQSVNNKTGAVQLSASDVNARPDSWMPTAEQVGADAKGTASSTVSTHNTATDAHNDMRLELKDINDRLNAFFDSDDKTLDELSEIVAYITSNKALIDSITTSKISVEDIINNLTTNVANKPLSAAQGVALKALIDAIKIPTKLSELSDDSTHRVVTDTEKTAWNAKAEVSAVPTKVSQLTNDSKYLTAVPDGYAKLEDIPTTPSDIGAQPSGNYALKSEVTTAVNESKSYTNTAVAQKSQVQLIIWEDED